MGEGSLAATRTVSKLGRVGKAAGVAKTSVATYFVVTEQGVAIPQAGGKYKKFLVIS